MDELELLCRRLLADRSVAADAASEARASESTDRLGALRAALAACRAREPGVARASEPAVGRRSEPEGDLAAAVAGELADACGRLPERDRELLALRDLLALPHEELGALLELDPDAVAGALAGARVALRTQLRGPGEAFPPCAERDRALRAIERRHDGLPLPESEEDWLIAHLTICRGCAQAHAAVLEAAACYGAWDACA